jgi:hypothetical protein
MRSGRADYPETLVEGLKEKRVEVDRIATLRRVPKMGRL